jgi:hypothetical protein
MPQTQSDFLQQFLTSGDGAPIRPSKPIPYEPTKLDKLLSPFTFTERVSAAYIKSLRDESTFTENMKAWVDYSDLIKDAFPDMNPYARMGLSFVASVVGDPLTWTGVGALTKVGKAASTTGKLAKTTAQQVAKGERALMTFAGVPIVKGEPVFQLSEKIGSKLKGTRVITALNRAFVSPTGHPVTDDLLRDSNDLKRYLENADGSGWVWGYAKNADEFDKALKARGIGKNARTATHQLLRRELERPGSIADPVIQDTAKKLRVIQDDVRKAELDAGFDFKNWEGDVDYWATIATPEFKKFLNQSGFFGEGSSRVWGSSHASMLNRKLGNIRVEGINAPVGSLDQYQAWAKSIGFDGEAFITDPFVTGAIRGQRAARAIANKHFVDQALQKVPGIQTFDLGAKYAEKSGRLVKDAAGNLSGTNAVKVALRGNLDKGALVDKGSLYRIVESEQINAPALKAELRAILDNTDGGFVSALRVDDILERLAKDGDLMRKLPTITKSGVKVHVMPKEVAQELGRVHSRLRDGGAAQALLGAFDQGQNIWKAYTLSLFPAYHFRNVVSNVYNNWLSGVDDAAPYVSSTLLQRAMKKSGGKLDDLVGSDIAKVAGVDDATLLRSAQRQGVLGEGFYGADVPEEILDLFKPGVDATTQQKILQTIKGNKILRKSRAFGTMLENNARLANYIDGVKKGMAAGGNFDEVSKAAALRVKKALFDYGDLTGWERDVMKRIMPFYCVPEESEILSRRGWLHYTDLKIGEEVLTVNPDNGKSEWNKVEDIAVFDFDDKLMRIENNSASFVSTYDHRWLTSSGGGKYNRRKIKRAYALNNSDSIILTGSGVETSDSNISVRDATVIGWIVTDGYTRTRNGHTEMMIYQSPKKFLPEVLDLIGKDAGKISYHPDTGVACVRIVGKYRKHLNKIYASKEDFPAIVGGLSREAAEAMYQAMMQAEGCTCIAPTTGHPFSSFVQRQGPVLDGFMMLLQMTGRAGHARLFHEKSGKDVATVYIKTRTTMKIAGSTIEAEPYKGKIWCPRIANSTWVMRQNGYMTVTGNTWSRKNIPLQIEKAFTDPGKIVSFDKTRRAIETQEFGGPKGDVRGIAEWMMLQYPIRLSVGKDGVERIGTIGGFIPTGDLLRLADPLNELYAMATPFLKEPVSQAMNYDPFFRSVIEQYPGQSSKFLGADMSNRMKHALRNIRILNEADRIIQTLDPRQMGSLKPEESLVRLMTGFRLYPQDPVKGMAYYEYELQKTIGARKSAIRKLERKASQGRIDAKLYEKELRRLLSQIEELEKRPIEIPK